MADGRITTFYSYKGGTGRSMALANFAWIMAASGKSVLAIDWDLEAPGLHRYFQPFLVDPELYETDGLIDAFWSLTATVVAKAAEDKRRYEADDGAEVMDALEDATRRLDRQFPTGGYIDFIGAGRQGGTYSERVNSFDWKRFYELGGAEMLSAAKGRLRERYDWVLIDSRTGVSDTSGICTIQMPETVAAFFTLNRQSIEGVAAVLRSIRNFRSASTDGSKINFFPIATRIENAEQKRLEAARVYARRTLADFLPEKMHSRQREYWDKMEISYRPAYAFEEVLAAFGDATGAAGAKDTMLSQVEETAQLIADDDDLRMPEITEADRNKVLTKYSFGALSEREQAQDDTDFLRRVLEKEQLWRKNKFHWRLLLSRRELDLVTPEDKKAFGRNMGFYHVQSERMRRLLRIGQIAASGTFIATIIAMLFLSYRILLYGMLYTPSLNGVVDALIIIFATVVAAWLVAMIARLVVALTLEKPDGVRLLDLLKLSLYGPRRPEISDYDPDRMPPS
jgi:cellulose biosynthesis protein BcsQ